jgi:UDPglucose 6-dehydrogenase
MKIAVVGSGFVGQATGRGLKKHGNEVLFIDVDEQKVNDLAGEGFEAHLADTYTKITTDVTMFCVPTPTKGGEIVLNYLKLAVKAFAERLKDHKDYHVVVVRSTVPPKTTREEVLPLIEKVSGKKAGKDFGLVMQPEYLREITASADFERPWFILIGQYDEKSGDLLEKVYRPFDAPIERCSLEEAEMQKYVHNVYNAVKIAFFNEMRLACKKEGWDADMIFRATAESCEGIWNPMYGLRDMGPFDGACLPKDSRALLQWGDSQGHKLGILKTVIQENLRHEAVMGKNKNVRVNYLGNISV